MPALEAVVVAWPVLEKFTLPVLGFLSTWCDGVSSVICCRLRHRTYARSSIHALSLSTRYKMPRVIGKVEGRGNGIKTVIFNVMDLSLALKRDPGEVCKFFGTELGAQVRE